MLLEGDDVPAAGAAHGPRRTEPCLNGIRPFSAWALLSSGRAILVDVRTSSERASRGFVRGSLAIPWNCGNGPDPQFADLLRARVPRDRAVLFLCRSGRRSALAADAASRAGYSQVFNVLEGFKGWRARGLPWTSA